MTSRLRRFLFVFQYGDQSLITWLLTSWRTKQIQSRKKQVLTMGSPTVTSQSAELPGVTPVPFFSMYWHKLKFPDPWGPGGPREPLKPAGPRGPGDSLTLWSWEEDIRRYWATDITIKTINTTDNNKEDSIRLFIATAAALDLLEK